MSRRKKVPDPDAITLVEAAALLRLPECAVTRLRREGFLIHNQASQRVYSRAGVETFLANPWINGNFPGTTGVRVAYDFKRSGKPKTATVKTAGGTVLRDYGYSYTKTVSFPGLGSVDMESGQLQKRSVSNAPAGNGDTTYDYNKSRLKSATNSNASLPDYDYGHDDVGNVTSEKIDGTSTFYGYDRAGQLCWQGPNDGDHINTTCQPGPTGSTDLDHDAAGNNTGTTTSPRAYNDQSQLTTNDGLDMTYSDLGNNLRVATGSTGSTGTQMVNSPLGITATKTGDDVTYYTRDSNGTILNSHGAGGTRNYFSEFNGSITALYNTAGTEVGSYTYSPYGKTDPTGTAATTNPLRYIGGYQDKTSTGDDGAYKLGARYYDTQGHFTQPDSIAGTINNPKTLTAYNYAGGDPINSSDPSGNYFGESAIDGGLSEIQDFGNSEFAKNFGKAAFIVGSCLDGALVGGGEGAFIGTAFGPEGTITGGIVGAAYGCGAGAVIAGAASTNAFGFRQ